jgi:hypothetical protein
MDMEPATARDMFLSSCIHVLHPLAAKDKPKSLHKNYLKLVGVFWASQLQPTETQMLIGIICLNIPAGSSKVPWGAPKSQCRFTRDHLHVQALGNFSIGHSEAIENSSLIITFSLLF